MISTICYMKKCIHLYQHHSIIIIYCIHAYHIVGSVVSLAAFDHEEMDESSALSKLLHTQA